MKTEIIELLKGFKQSDVENYASYCLRLSVEKKTNSSELKNPFMKSRTPAILADYFKRVSAMGLVFDGKHITLQSTGISFDYIAYKNKMYIAYPETKIDLGVVLEGDDFTYENVNGEIIYKFKPKEMFADTSLKTMVGAFCLVKNSRGEFMTTLSKEEIEKHRKVAKTDYIWKAWFKEMVMKTVIKKACKIHFDDVFEKVEEVDNENYSVENPIDLELKYKSEIDDIDNLEHLVNYYNKNKGAGKEFDKYIAIRKNQLKNANK